MEKEIILVDNLKKCQAGANYIYKVLMEQPSILSVNIDIEVAAIAICHVGEKEKGGFIELL